MKYQFCIRFENIDANSAASKAVLDCNAIFSEQGYKDHTFTVGDNSDRPKYYWSLIRQLTRFYFQVKPGSVVAVQYPLLSINNVFKFFIKLLRPKGVKFFCVIHDVESLRNSTATSAQIATEAADLNCYDAIIVHNDHMGDWLKNNGVTVSMVNLEVFDYLTDSIAAAVPKHDAPIAFAGNLKKGGFIYDLNALQPLRFNIYGPGLDQQKQLPGNAIWKGQFAPDEIPRVMQGSFGLLWDGNRIDRPDEDLGNYMRYNNPHKFSLYIATGLPVIASADTAIAKLIKQYNIGILINDLNELPNLIIDEDVYKRMANNVANLRQRITTGGFFTAAIDTVERLLTAKTS